MRNATDFLRKEYEQMVKDELDWRIKVLNSPTGPRAVVDGEEKIILCSNNYLDLGNDRRLKEAAKKAVDLYGAGSGSVRPIAGTMTIHRELEKKIALFKGREDALYYQTGFAVNSGLIPQLVDQGDIVISDELNHGSIIDGIRLSKADRSVYRHGSVYDFEDKIREADKKGYRRILVITDGVFSMDGDIAPVKEMVKLTGKYGAMLYVDDAHGEGVLGKGKGIGAHFNIEKQIDVEVGTFSKAFGVVGGLIAGSSDLIKFAYNKSRTWLLSGSAPPPTIASCMEALNIIEKEPERVDKLWKNREQFMKGMRDLGFDTGNSQTPIIPVMIGDSGKAKEFSEILYKNGVFALPIVYPMVAKDKARIRTIMNAGHTETDLIEAINAFEKAGKQLNII
ncbi:MAG: aminotransferase class I/II-fold pyridoxal phosphate-dependent enzyme [Candidatus Thermoplasmatota archaeon]|jgi:glycine C-acetyltransferase|nr:aminotransferase class I/II-fold pyridoxal phosphate-dependent enzyme [Candidatus Thermoplasmatota archaeon]MCL5963862.1 aminotransferase class I/II-fold pyridoxal phosphate-dependent enzyme [Candidatus Thermoplasmatota archaeon]